MVVHVFLLTPYPKIWKRHTVFIFTRLVVPLFCGYVFLLLIYKIKINKTIGKQSTPKQRHLLYQNLLSLSLSYKISLDLFWISGKNIPIEWEIKLDTIQLCFEDHAYAAQSPTTLFFGLNHTNYTYRNRNVELLWKFIKIKLANENSSLVRQWLISFLFVPILEMQW